MLKQLITILSKIALELKKTVMVNLTGKVVYKATDGKLHAIYTCRCGHIQHFSVRNRVFLMAIVNHAIQCDCDDCEINANGLGI